MIEPVIVLTSLLPTAFVRLRCLAGEKISSGSEWVSPWTSSTMASSEAKAGLAVALSEVQQCIIADGFEQVLLTSIHFYEKEKCKIIRGEPFLFREQSNSSLVYFISLVLLPKTVAE